MSFDKKASGYKFRWLFHNIFLRLFRRKTMDSDHNTVLFIKIIENQRVVVPLRIFLTSQDTDDQVTAIITDKC